MTQAEDGSRKAAPSRRPRTSLLDRHREAIERKRVEVTEEPEDDVTLPGKLDVVDVPRIELRVEREAEEGAERRVVVDGATCRIGSHPSNELVLQDRHVSRFHCCLRREKGGWRVDDGGSLNGTYLNGIRVRDADLPRGTCRLTVGGSEVVVRELQPVTRERVPVRSNFGAIVGGSLVMRQMFALLDRVARSDSTVVIQGESGTGKELVASEIVRVSGRAQGPFVIVDCGAIAPNLIESELFGHVRGAFTGADRDRVGAFEAANGGTLFLDELGELPPALQPKLLRVLESREVRRLGGSRPVKVDVRVLAATNRKLEREVNQGRFREDLFFRLSVVTVHVPPLRERLEDIPLLVESMLVGMGAEDQRGLFGEDVLAALARHEWPGNVRELRNFVERSLVLQWVDPAPMSQRRGSSAPCVPTIETPFKVAKDELVASFEKRYVSELLRWSEGRVGKAAQKAGIDRMYLYRLMQRHGMKRDGQQDD